MSRSGSSSRRLLRTGEGGGEARLRARRGGRVTWHGTRDPAGKQPPLPCPCLRPYLCPHHRGAVLNDEAGYRGPASDLDCPVALGQEQSQRFRGRVCGCSHAKVVGNGAARPLLPAGPVTTGAHGPTSARRCGNKRVVATLEHLPGPCPQDGEVRRIQRPADIQSARDGRRGRIDLDAGERRVNVRLERPSRLRQQEMANVYAP